MKDLTDIHGSLGRERLRDIVEKSVVPLMMPSDEFSELLAARRFDKANPPAPAVPIFRLGEAIIATQGNLVGIQAQDKAGKSAVAGALIGATMAPQGDCLGFVSANGMQKAVIHFDTEQSPADHHRGILRALERAGKSSEPDWLRSYCLTDIPIPMRRVLLRFEIRRAADECNGIHSVLLDGLGDFCKDPNDPAEAFELIDELHQQAIEHSTAIICVLHENPGSEKTRGHLGSQLARKAETNLRLVKDECGVTVIFAERARNAHIPREKGQRFAWSDEAKMHVSVATLAEEKAGAKKEQLDELALEIFRGLPAGRSLSWGEVHKRIERLAGLKHTGARRRFKDLTKAGAIVKNGEGYQLPS
ncbi:hypothetical protein ACXR0O_23315 [Verrucomicrobiota bacterium sgz303538]